MAGISDLFGRSAYIEQLVLWNTLGQVLSASMAPALAQLQQDMWAKHPVQVLDPATLVDLAARGIITVSAATSDGARSGIDAARMSQLLDMRTVRLAPADLATLSLRSYLTTGDAEAIARPQGVDSTMMAALTYLAGDALGPEQLAMAVRRGLVPRSGTGPNSVSFQQGIAESRLHDKWGNVLFDLMAAVLSPPDAATAVVRNFMTQDAAAAEAAKSGVDASLFTTLIHLAGDAPGPQQLAEALRRGAIPATGTGAGSTSFVQGIAEGRLADKWAPVIKDLSLMWPTPVDALDASVKGVFSAADGKAMYERLGGDPQFYDWLLYSIGNSPTPDEAAVLAYRGIIPWDGTGTNVTSYAQAVKESRYRDKWADAYRQLAQHIPTPGEVTTWLAHKLVTESDAHTWLVQNGLTADVAAAYVAEAEYEAISDYRGLTQSAVIDMYVGHTVDRDQAISLLEALHVSGQAAGLLLDYADMRYAIDSINKSVERIATLFTGRKISDATANDALVKLGISPSAIAQIIQDWELQAAADVKTLTASEIVDGWYYSALTDDEALQSLEAIGYTPFDAWVLLSNKAKGPLPNKPARIVAAPQGAVIPGVT